MNEIHVRLADAPTDVLVQLVDHGPCKLTDLISALAPKAEAPGDAPAIVNRALMLLLELGAVHLVKRGSNLWDATSAGARLIAAARQNTEA